MIIIHISIYISILCMCFLLTKTRPRTKVSVVEYSSSTINQKYLLHPPAYCPLLPTFRSLGQGRHSGGWSKLYIFTIVLALSYAGSEAGTSSGDDVPHPTPPNLLLKPIFIQCTLHSCLYCG